MNNYKKVPYFEEPKINFFLYPPMNSCIDENVSMEDKLDLNSRMDIGTKFTIYISVPYCRKRCNSCTCFRGLLPERSDINQFIDEYVETLIMQMRAYAQTVRFSNATCFAIYIGGGTGSVLNSKQIGRLLNEIRELFNLCNDVEITLEGNPIDFKKEYLIDIKKHGVTRISVGYQSGQDDVLQALNTSHCASVGKQALHEVMETGFPNVNIDLLYNVPGQTFEAWEQDVNEIVEVYKPQSISVGDYMVYKGSRAEKLINEGVLPKQKSINEANKWYIWTCKRLEEAGYKEHVRGIFAKKGYEQKYVVNSCCEGGEILGLGAGAFSYVDGYQYRNVFQSEVYKKTIMQKKFFLADQVSVKASLLNKMQRFVIHSLYAEEIRFKKFYERFSVELFEVFGEIIDRLEENGIVSITESCVRLTELGKKWRKSVYYEFYGDEYK